nr:PREDICTED: CD83 antigen-like [Lepisosteus oculatus]
MWFLPTLVFVSGLIGVPSSGAPVLEVEESCGGDTVLTCVVTPEPGVQYRSVSWYKVTEGLNPLLTGVIKNNLLKNSSRKYIGFNRTVELLQDGSLSLVLRNITEEDSGKYSCFLSAPLGKQNKEGYISLRVTGCTDEIKTNYLDAVWEVVVRVLWLAVSFLVCFLCWRCVKNVLRGSGPQVKQVLKMDQQKTALETILVTNQSGGETQPTGGKLCQPEDFWV